MNKHSIIIKLDDTTYKIFESAAETVAKSGIRVPVAQLVEVMVNNELTRIDSKKIAKRFLQSLMSKLAYSTTTIDEEKGWKEKFVD